MTLQKQYNLPNCRIVLEGLSNNNSDTFDIVMKAECHFIGHDKFLSGGQIFWQNLVNVVHNYAQECLSGLRHPLPPPSSENTISLTKNEAKFTHHLTFSPLADEQDQESSSPLEIELNTVQLFDLVEAIDQFLADTNTLPDLKPPLEPLSKRFSRPDEPIIQRATPPLVGLVTVAIASFAVFFMPIPERKPVETKTQEKTEQTTETLPKPTPVKSPEEEKKGTKNPEEKKPE